MGIKRINALEPQSSIGLNDTEFIVDYNSGGNIQTKKVNIQTIYNSIKENIEDMIKDKINKSYEDIFNQTYPVGSIYITTGSKPSIGTWKLVSNGMCLWGVGESEKSGKEIEAGLPDITISDPGHTHSYYRPAGSHVHHSDNSGLDSYADSITGKSYTGIELQKSDIYGRSKTVQPPAFTVHIFERTAL